jgi:hypothetical protein
MKLLILILLTVTYASAQERTLADFARQERARQAEVQGKNIRVYTTEDIRTTPPAADAKPAGDVAAETPAAAGATAAPAADPVQEWLAETEKLRSQIRELIDREATTQLDINRITNEVYAADTNETAVARARAELGTAQQKLADVREQLAKSRLELAKREQDGPPKK